MKIKKLVSVGILLLFVAPTLFAADYKKEIPLTDAMKAFCGTWIIEGSGGLRKFVWNLDGTYKWYYANDILRFSGTFKIEKAWKDREGSIWCIVWRSWGGNSWTLTKISDDGNVKESALRLNRGHLPTEIDPDDDPLHYYKFNREKNE
jgi:hypothetical protein